LAQISEDAVFVPLTTQQRKILEKDMLAIATLPKVKK
jgi:hypothetical protein